VIPWAVNPTPPPPKKPWIQIAYNNLQVIMIHTEQTSTTHSLTFQNVISDAHTLEMIYMNTFPWLWEHPACIQIFPAVVRQSTVLWSMDNPKIWKYLLHIVHLTAETNK
jgi:hypothetical protein